MYQIPKMEVEVAAYLVGGTSYAGTIYITENLLSYTGVPRLEDFLNQRAQRFFPITDKVDGTRLLNRTSLIYLQSSEDDSKELIDLLRLKPNEVFIVMTDGTELSGLVYPNLPQDMVRVSDFFNQGLHYLPIYQETQKLILNIDHIATVID